jgi:hypothetical protein
MTADKFRTKYTVHARQDRDNHIHRFSFNSKIHFNLK